MMARYDMVTKNSWLPSFFSTANQTYLKFGGQMRGRSICWHINTLQACTLHPAGAILLQVPDLAADLSLLAAMTRHPATP